MCLIILCKVKYYGWREWAKCMGYLVKPAPSKDNWSEAASFSFSRVYSFALVGFLSVEGFILSLVRQIMGGNNSECPTDPTKCNFISKGGLSFRYTQFQTGLRPIFVKHAIKKSPIYLKKYWTWLMCVWD